MTATGHTPLSLEAALQQAVAYHQAGRLQEAERLYRAILQAQPRQGDANHNLGALAVQVGQPAAGLPYLKAALAINPSHGQYAISYARALLAAGQPREVVETLQAALRRGLDTPSAHRLLEDARAALNGETVQDKMPPPEEIERLIALFNAKQYEALERQARSLAEKYPEAGFIWKILGASLHPQGKDALPALRKATLLLPDDPEAHNNLGNALRDIGQLDDAVQSYRHALEINPDFAEAHNNLGVALNALRRYDEAMACFRRALKVRPGYANAQSNLGNALRDVGQLDEAIASYQRALEINPDLLDAHDNLLFARHYQPGQPPALLLSEARRFGELAARRARPYTQWPNTPEPGRRLRIGLVSGDLCNHPVGKFVKGVLAALASSASGQLSLVAYPTHTYTDAVSAQIQECCDGWHPSAGLSDEALARRIHEDGIDILIDLSGHTAHNRLPMFAWKPAPVQATWLGYLATTGVAAIDYLIADPWTLPETEAPHFTEKIWRLPESYLCFTPPDADIPVAALPALNNGHITFGSFNNLAKMNDEVVALWARVLLEIPGSRLLLKAKQLAEPAVQQSIVARFAAEGIGAERLILKSQAPQAEHLALYHQVDIALDPFPYPGITTSVESLWMGVPVLPLAGERFLSRQGIGLLMNTGLPEWIANDADDYVARAVAHAGDLKRLATLRAGLREQVLASPIFDTRRFARHFEAALRGMWQEWCGRQARAS